MVITKQSGVSLGLMLGILALLSGALWKAHLALASITRVETQVVNIERRLKELNDSLHDDGALLHAHLIDPALHHARFGALEARVRILEESR